MDEQTYQDWWQLHVRAARGEVLRESEQRIYDAGRKTLDEEEARFTPNDALALYRLKWQIAQTEREIRQLQGTQRKLDAHIAVLERDYDSLTGHRLTSPYAASEI